MRKLATFAAMTALLVFVGAGFLQARTFVLPHVLERSGSITNTQFSFDTTIYANYVGGIGGVTGTGGATVDLYLFNNASGAPMTNNGQEVCNSCSFTLSATARKASISIDSLISARGGSFDANVKLGFGLVVVGGADPENVALQGFVVNSHTSAFDLSVFGFDPVPIAAAAN